MIHLRSTAIVSYLRCREEFRQHYINRRISAFASIHQEFGIACHLIAEHFWCEKPFAVALDYAASYMNNPRLESRVHPNDRKRWQELKEILPDCAACYYDSVEWQQPAMVEKEWTLLCPWNPEITLGGRIDRAIAGPIGGKLGVMGPSAVKLIDLKTCSEIEGYDAMLKKTGWERSYHDMMVKDFGIGLYDWYLRQIGLTPTEIVLECLMKPYARYGKKASVRHIPVPEVIAYRERFDALLMFITQEIYHYIREHRAIAPWPMNISACSGKYGNCSYLAVCNFGISRQTEKLYQTADLGDRELERAK